MKFDTEMYHKKGKHCEHRLIGVRPTSLAATFSIFTKKKYDLESANTCNPVFMAQFLKLSVVIQ